MTIENGIITSVRHVSEHMKECTIYIYCTTIQFTIKVRRKKRLDQVGLKAESACQHSQQVREHPVVPARRAACVYECVKENKTKSGQAAARKKGFIKSSRVRYFSRLSASRSL